MTRRKPPEKLNAKDYERLGRWLAAIYETGFMNRKRFYFFTLLRGILMGLGSVIGATIVVALLLWVLSLFSSLPVADQLRDTIQTEQQP